MGCTAWCSTSRPLSSPESRVGDFCIVCSHGRADAHLGSGDRGDRIAVYSRVSMKPSLPRLVATLLLSVQLLPVGLPLLCDQVRLGKPASCAQQMAARPSAHTIGAATDSPPCANSAFCATTATAVVALGGAVSVSAGESHVIGFGVSTLVPADPLAPLPPPPQA